VVANATLFVHRAYSCWQRWIRSFESFLGQTSRCLRTVHANRRDYTNHANESRRNQARANEPPSPAPIAMAPSTTIQPKVSHVARQACWRRDAAG